MQTRLAPMASLLPPETLALRTQQVPASYVAVLSDAQGRPTWSPTLRAMRRMDLKVLRPTPAEPGTQWLLWGHTAQGERVALGRIDLAARSRVELAGTAEQELSKLATLSVTIAPEGVVPPAHRHACGAVAGALRQGLVNERRAAFAVRVRPMLARRLG